MEICVNDYIRTKDGRIDKVTDIANNYILVKSKIKIFEYGESYAFIKKSDILKHSSNIIDLIKDEDIVILEYKSPKYRERITRRFEVSKIDDDISFENAHCNFRCKIGDEKIKDDICKNIKIKSVVTKEQFKNIEYKVEE